MVTVRQYLAWAERHIAGVVQREGLRMGVVRIVQGPLTLTFAVRLLHPSPATLRKLLGLGPALAQALQVESVRVSDSAAGILIEIPSPVQRTPSAETLASHTQGLHVAVGLDQFRRPVRVDLRQHGALLWVGPSRRGKTESLKSTVYGLARANPWHRLGYVVLSQKQSDWAAFAPAAGCLGIVSQPEECAQVLDWVAAQVLHDRAKAGRRQTALLIVVDDLLNLLERTPEIAGPLAEIASMGAGLGVHLLAGTQEAGSKRGTGGPAVESNCTCRIVYRSSSAAAAARATGMKETGVAQLTSARGDALLVVDGEVTRIATGWADDRAVLQLAQGRSALVPWRSGEGVQNEAERGKTGQNGQNGGVLPSPYQPKLLPEEGREMQNENGPLLSSDRPPTASERALLRELYAAMGSKEKVYAVAWGFKNGKVHSWLTHALAEASTSEDAEAEDDADVGTGTSTSASTTTSASTMESITIRTQRAQEE